MGNRTVPGDYIVGQDIEIPGYTRLLLSLPHRMKALMLSVILVSVSGSLGTFMPEPFGYGILRIITGMGGIGCFMVTFVLAVEYIGAKYTMLFGIAIEIPFAIGELIFGLEGEE